MVFFAVTDTPMAVNSQRVKVVCSTASALSSPGCLHGVGITIGVVHKWDWGKWAIRAAGAVIALVGVFLWRAFA